MLTCPACRTPQAVAQRFCGHCGASLQLSSAATSPPPDIDDARPVERPRRSSDRGGYLPGVVLANRYRMVALLGRGGMGEVYRADDLTLGQPVALKFLPRDVEQDPERRDRFLTEVRLSLRVTHPNVCRVYDIAQAEGRHVLSMEYVDGEDLASLLRRIGRLPEDKAVEISRQLCAGLQAAHDEEVLHRDLKPANVMLDGRGRAKITDFGLAGATEGISGLEARAGTPQYMAPEQIAGHALSKQTDIYALGLVLYELFTGKQAFESNTLEDLERRKHSPPTSPAAHLSGLNPAIERAILRCLDPDPTGRPASASELGASILGTDPLAKAMAAGETPSPELVAQAGGSGVLSPAVASLCLAAILVGLTVVWYLLSQYTMLRWIPLTMSTSELRVAARTTLATIGFPSQPYETASGFGWAADYVNLVERNDQSPIRWDRIASTVPSPVSFWYRESPVPLVPFNSFGLITAANPPMTRPGMTIVRTGPTGHLASFEAVPPARIADSQPPAAEPDWGTFFTLANLNLSEFQAVTPMFTPPQASDARRAWVKAELRVEAAAFAGRPVWFDVIPPWRGDRASESVPPTPGQVAWTAVTAFTRLGLLVVAGLLTRRHIRMGRSDFRGAWRFTLVYFVFRAGRSIVRTSTSISGLGAVWANHLGVQLVDCVQVLLFYLAIEPYVRKLWPDTLIAWNRVLDGQFRDPMVGRHLLFGALGGLGVSLVFLSPGVIGSWVGSSPPPLPVYGLTALGGVRPAVGAVFDMVLQAFVLPVVFLLLLLMFRVVLRRQWLANLAFLTLNAVLAVTGAPVLISDLPVVAVIVAGLSVVVVTRFGIFASVVGILFSQWGYLPITMDPASWYFPWSVVTMLAFAAVAIYGFFISLGGQRLFRDPLEGPVTSS